ncbi:MAG: SoxR reducing system RseC family protein [Pseudomonadota bacterium]
MNKISSDKDLALIEGVARVVAIEGDVAWLEPEQSTSCGGCTSSPACGEKGLGTVASRLAARRFPITDHPGLAVGERVVVGVRGDALMKAAATAYAVPLMALLVAGGIAQWAADNDGITLAASVVGLALGLGLAHLGAIRLRGVITPRFLRRAGSSPVCHLT